MRTRPGNCSLCKARREEYDQALKYEALAYGRLIAHKTRHETTETIPRMQYLRLVSEVAKAYSGQSDYLPRDEIPPDPWEKPGSTD